MRHTARWGSSAVKSTLTVPSRRLRYRGAVRKGLILVVGAIASVAGAAVYFAGPAPAAPSANVAPVLVDGTPAEVIGRLRAASLNDFMRKEAAGTGLDAYAGTMSLKHEGGDIREERSALWVGSEKILQIVTRVRPSGTRTELAVSAELTPSNLTRQGSLSAQDRALMAALIERAASDYALSLTGGHPQADPVAQAHGVEAAFGLDRRAQQLFEARVLAALKNAFGDRTVATPAADEPDAVTVEDEDDGETFGKPADDGPDVDAPERAVGAAPDVAGPEADTPVPDTPAPQGDED